MGKAGRIKSKSFDLILDLFDEAIIKKKLLFVNPINSINFEIIIDFTNRCEIIYILVFHLNKKHTQIIHKSQKICFSLINLSKKR